MTRSPLSDHRHLRHATPAEAEAWRRLREMVIAQMLGGEHDGEIRLQEWYRLAFIRWLWHGKHDR